MLYHVTGILFESFKPVDYRSRQTEPKDIFAVVAGGERSSRGFVEL